MPIPVTAGRALAAKIIETLYTYVIEKHREVEYSAAKRKKLRQKISQQVEASRKEWDKLQSLTPGEIQKAVDKAKSQVDELRNKQDLMSIDSIFAKFSVNNRKETAMARNSRSRTSRNKATSPGAQTRSFTPQDPNVITQSSSKVAPAQAQVMKSPSLSDMLVPEIAYESQFNYPLFLQQVSLDFGLDPTSRLGRVAWEDVYYELTARYALSRVNNPPTNTTFINIINYQVALLYFVTYLDNVVNFKSEIPFKEMFHYRSAIMQDADYVSWRANEAPKILEQLCLPPRIVGMIQMIARFTNLGNHVYSMLRPAGTEIDATDYISTAQTLEQNVLTNLKDIRVMSALFPEWRGSVDFSDLGDQKFLWINSQVDGTTQVYPRTNLAGDTLRIYVPSGASQIVLPTLSYWDSAATVWKYGYIQATASDDNPIEYIDGTPAKQLVNDGFEARYCRRPLAYGAYTYEYDIEQSIVAATDTLDRKRVLVARWLWGIFDSSMS
jgi:hypothetical protein